MYVVRGGQTNLFDDETLFGGVALDSENTWIKLAKMIPWEHVEKRYAQTFEGKATGNPGCSCRMAMEPLIIKERYRFSDQITLDEIQMNPYFQYFIGLMGFTHKAPVEFGSKIAVSLANSYAQIETLSWDVFNEGTTLIESANRYFKTTTIFPHKFLKTKSSELMKNLRFVSSTVFISTRPNSETRPRIKRLYYEQLGLECEESVECSAIEGFFRCKKRRYTLNLIKIRLADTSEVSMRVALLTVNFFRKVKILFAHF